MNETTQERASRRARLERRARLVVFRADRLWLARIVDRSGRVVYEDNVSVHPGSWERLLDATLPELVAVQRVEQMGHELREWDWLVDQAKAAL